MLYLNTMMQDILDHQFWSNDVRAYITSLGVFILVLILLRIFKFVVIKNLGKLSKKTKTKLDDYAIEVIDRLGWPIYVFIALFVAIKPLVMPAFLQTIVKYVTVLVVAFYITRAVVKVIDFATHAIITKKQKKEDDTSAVDLMGKLFKILVWVIAVLFVLQNLGYNITGLMAGLGIGGVAVAFALQSVLEDIFSSFSIYFDKPFEAGDFIIVGNDMGTVKKIGIKTTRIQTLQGQELVISNKELTQARVNNYKKMEKRRILFSFGVTYETPVKKLEKIPAMVRKIIDAAEDANTDRVHFKSFGDSSLLFEIVYYVSTGDYNKYMDIQQSINLEIMKAFEKNGISMAYPTQTLYVNKMK